MERNIAREIGRAASEEEEEKKKRGEERRKERVNQGETSIKGDRGNACSGDRIRIKE